MIKKVKIITGFIFCVLAFCPILFLQLTGYAQEGEYEKFYNNGQALYEQGKFEEAKVEFEKARKILQKKEVLSEPVVLEGQQEAEKKLDASMKELEQIKQERDNLAKQLEQSEKEKEKLRKNLERANERLKRKKVSPAALEQKNKKLEAAVMDQQKHISSMEEYVKQVNKEKASLAMQVMALKEELVNVYQRKGEPEVPTPDKNFIEKKLSKLKKFIAEKKKSGQDKHLTVRDKLEHYEELKTQQMVLLEKLNQETENSKALNQKLGLITNELEFSKKALAKKEHEKGMLMLDIALLEKINDILTKEKQDMLDNATPEMELKKKIDKQEAALDEKAETIEQLETQLRELNNKHNELLKENNSLTKEASLVAKLKGDIEHLEDKIDDAEKQEKDLKKEINDYERTVKQKDKEIALLSDKKEDIEDELADTKEDLSQAEDENRELSRRNKELERALKSDDKDRKIKLSEKDKLKEDLAKAEEDLSQAEDENKELSRRNKELERALKSDDKDRKIKSLMSEKDKLKEDLANNYIS